MEVSTHLYGQEINAETYAIAKADLLLKSVGEAADIVGGPEYSTLSNDAFPYREFDFMLSNAIRNSDEQNVRSSTTRRWRVS